MYCLPRTAQRPIAQRFHEVDHLRARFRRLRHGDLLAFDFLLDSGFDARSHVVRVSAGIEGVGGLLIDQLARELELGFFHLGLRNLDVLDRSDFAAVEKLLHDQSLLDGADHDDVLLAARRPAPDGAAIRFAERRGEKGIGLGAELVRSQVIGLVEEHRIDRFDRHEFRDLRALRPCLLEGLQLLGREHDVLVLGEFVTLDHVFAGDRHVFFDADVLLLEPRAAGLVQKVEGDRSACLGRGEELHRNRDQPERDTQRAYRSCSHRVPPVVLASARLWTHYSVGDVRNLHPGARYRALRA